MTCELRFTRMSKNSVEPQLSLCESGLKFIVLNVKRVSITSLAHGRGNLISCSFLPELKHFHLDINLNDYAAKSQILQSSRQ